MKRRILSLLIVFAMIFSIIPQTLCVTVMGAENSEWEYETYTYNGEQGVILTRYLGSDTDIYVPGKISDGENEYTVLKLGDNLFQNNTTVNSVTLGTEIKVIGHSAFQGATNLVCIVTNEGLAEIEASAFSGCTAFNSVILYDGVTAIGENAFADCSNLIIYCNENNVGHRYAADNNIPFEIMNSTTAVTYTEDDITYSIVNGQATIVSCSTSKSGVVTVPASVNGKSVVVVSSAAFQDCSQITEIILPEGIKNIGSYAFSMCSSLQKINIPDNVTQIDLYTFNQCSKLSDVKLGRNITKILHHAFWKCTSLRTINLPEKTYYLEYCAFAHCSALKAVSFPYVTNIGSGVFLECSSLQYAYLPNVVSIGAGPSLKCFPDNTVIGCKNSSSIKNYANANNYMVKITDNADDVVVVQQQDNATYVNIDGTIRILQFSFGNSQDGVIPQTIDDCPVTEIRSKAFSGFNNLRTLRMFGNIEKLPANKSDLFTPANPNVIFIVAENSYAYDYVSQTDNRICITADDAEPQIEFGTHGDYLNYVIINGSTYIVSSNSVIPEVYTVPYAINGNVIEGYNEGPVTKLNGIVTLEEGFKTLSKNISPVLAKYVGIPKSITQIEDNVLNEEILYGCYENSYAYEYLSSNNYNYVVISEDTEPYFYEENKTQYLIFGNDAAIVKPTESVLLSDLIFPENVNGAVVRYVLAGAYSYKYTDSVSLPDTIEYIGYSAFRYCYFESIKLPQNLKYIGSSSFMSCLHLTHIEIPGNVKKIKEDAFGHCDELRNVSIGEGTTTIEKDAFEYLTNLKISIPSSVTLIDNKAFLGNNGLLILCDSGSYAENYAETNGWLYLCDVEDPETVIANYYGNLYVVGTNGSVVIAGVKDVPSTIVVPETIDGNVVTGIQPGVFSYHKQITGVVLPDSITELPNRMFSNCTALKNIQLPSRITRIPCNIFESCSSLEEFVLPANVTVIENGAFSWTSSLSKLIFNDKIERIDDYAFCGSGITSIEFPSSLKTIGESAFSGCQNLSNIKFNEKLESIGDTAFHACPSITELEIGPSAITLGDSCFQDCTGLRTVNITAPINKIEERVFMGCANLETVIMNETITNIGWYTFYRCSKLKNIYMGNIKTINDAAFWGCSSLESIYLSKDAKYFYGSADIFAECNKLLICCYKDSAAHDFAVKNNIAYYLLEETSNPEIAYGTGISGTVTYTDGTPAADATVELLYKDGTLKESVKTDSNGAYNFTYAEVGKYVIRAENAEGNSGSENIGVRRKSVFDVYLFGNTNLTIKNSVSISGNVTDDSGEVIENAVISLLDKNGLLIKSAVSNSDGNYTLDNISNGDYTIRATYSNGSAAVGEITVLAKNGNITHNFVIRVGASISGSVVDEKNNPVVWADITVTNENGDVVSITNTDQNGYYKINRLPLGNYGITAVYESYETKLTGSTAVIADKAEDITADTIIMKGKSVAKVNISGKVTAHGQKQVSTVIIKDVFMNELAVCYTTENGKYTFSDIPDGTYTIIATTQSYGAGYTVIMIADGQLVSGSTNITVYKMDTVEYLEDQIYLLPNPDAGDNAINSARDGIIEAKNLYDSLSTKNKKQVSPESLNKLNSLIAIIMTDKVTVQADNNASVCGLETIWSEQDIREETNTEIVINISETADFENSEIEEKASEDEKTIMESYDIDVTKTKDGKKKNIKNITKDTEGTGNVALTFNISEEYQNHKNYSIIHMHNGQIYTLVDIDDNPNTITVETDKFSEFALAYDDKQESLDNPVIDTGETECLITFMNYDNAILQQDNVGVGTIPQYVRETPTKPSDNKYHYTFKGWSPEITNVTGDVTYTAQFDTAAHTWNDGEITTAPTCEKTGVKTFTCTECGQTKTETIGAIDHNYGDWSITVEPTTETQGEAQRTCMNDSTHIDKITLPVLTDTSVWALESYIAPTETTDGSQVYTSDYGNVTIIIPAIGHTHTMTTYVAKAATCTESGNIAYWECSGCNKLFSDEDGTTEITKADTIIAAKGHTEVEIPAVTAICTTGGKTAGVKCSVCGAVLKAPEDIPATGHKWGEWETAKSATETEDGEKTRTCSACGETETQVIPATGHTCDWGDWTITTAPTLTATGKAERVCKTKANHTESVDLPVLTDTTVWTYEETKAPTQDTDGEGKYTSVYGEVKITLPATGADKFSIRYDGGNAIVNAPKADTYTVLFAAYDGSGRLTSLSAQTVTVEKGETTVAPIDKFTKNTTVKVMLWESVLSMKPLCPADGN